MRDFFIVMSNEKIKTDARFLSESIRCSIEEFIKNTGIIPEVKIYAVTKLIEPGSGRTNLPIQVRVSILINPVELTT